MANVRTVYLATRKVPDLLWNLWVARPLGAVVVAGVEGTRITPNQITLSSYLAVAGASVLLVFWPGYWGLVTAVLVCEFAYVLDCADGMLARWRKVHSEVGHLLDFLIDELKAFLLVAAVSIRLFRDTQDPGMLLWGIFGLVGLASGVALTTFLRRPELSSRTAASAPTAPRSLARRAIAAVERVAKLLIHYPSYIWIAAAVGHIEYFLFPYVVVNSLYAVRTLLGVAVRFGRVEPRRGAE